LGAGQATLQKCRTFGILSPRSPLPEVDGHPEFGLI